MQLTETPTSLDIRASAKVQRRRGIEILLYGVGCIGCTVIAIQEIAAGKMHVLTILLPVIAGAITVMSARLYLRPNFVLLDRAANQLFEGPKASGRLDEVRAVTLGKVRTSTGVFVVMKDQRRIALWFPKTEFDRNRLTAAASKFLNVPLE